MAARLAIAIFLIVATVGWARSAEDFDPERLRQAMLRLIAADTAATSAFTGVATIDPKIMAVLAEVPRHRFVPEPFQAYAYNNHPLPLGYEQNIAAPFLVALMTHLAELEADDVVFETGTGAGYHAAVLAQLAAEVYSVEVVEPLAHQAARRLEEMGTANVRIKPGDGYFGWVGEGPFDAIIVKEAVDHVPTPLLNQLKPGGRMVIPLGAALDTQYLTVIRKSEDGRVTKKRVLPVRFSPLQGGERT
ncbi:MAG: protein-L-isoaspartate(D-aspartate) O-methyltransferase [Pseudomonadota bacterium]